MVSHFNSAKQNNLGQFSLLNVEPCKQAPSDIQHTKPQCMLEQKQKESKPSNVKHILKLKRFGVKNIFFQ